MRVYLAAPFFTAPQAQLVAKLEAMLSRHHLDFYSPRTEGVLLGKDREERAKMAPKIFASNCRQIDQSDVVFAVVDDRDQGVTWEIGYAYAREKGIVSFTQHDYGLNVMISECVRAHLKGLESADLFFGALGSSKSLDDAVAGGSKSLAET